MADLIMLQGVMIRLCALFFAIALAACSETQPLSQNDPAKTVVPLTYSEPDGADADYDSPVAPYVLAHGAGPSRLSPDGSVIATRLSLTGDRQLYVMDAKADNPQATLTQITFGSGITFFEFSPTGALIYGADNNGDERENYWMTAPDDAARYGWSEPRLILPATEQGFRQFGGFTGDGTMIVFSSTERNGVDFDVYTADVATGAATRVYEGVFGNYVQAVSPDGATAIISEAVGEDSDKLFMLDLETGVRTVLSDPTPRANHTDAGVDYVGHDAIILATNRDGDYASLVQLSLSGAPAEPIEAPLRDVDGLSLCGDSLAYTVNWSGFSESWVKPLSSFPKRIEGLPQGVHTVDCSADQLLVRVSGSDRPGDLFLVDLNDLGARSVFSSDLGELDPASLISPEVISLTAQDGLDVFGLLYRPTLPITLNSNSKLSSPLPPVVFMVHGGPTAQSRPSWNGTVQYLLSCGIAVFQPNVRGSTGFGRTYVTLDDRRKRLDSVRDLVDMLDWLETDGRVDTSRAAVQGGSYGGYMVNAVLADYPDAFDAGIALFGVGDWVTALEVASPGLKASDRIEYGDIADPEWRAFYTEISPIVKADQIRVPVLYSHGVMDPRIDMAETEIMVRALRENGVRADYIRIPDEGHGWRKLSNRLYYERVQAEFLEDVLREAK